MKIMAIDLGDARSGVAVCDRTEMIASPVGVIHEKQLHNVVLQVSKLAQEYGVDEIVIGYPRNMDGSSGSRAQKSELFSKLLSQLVSQPIRLWDERCTTVSAIEILNTTDTRGKKRKNVVDAVAAVLILENYLSFRKNNGPAQPL